MWIIDNSWLMQKLPGWKPDWFLGMRLLAEKLINILLEISLSNILPQIGNKETSRWFLIFCLLRFLWMGTIFHFFHSEGNKPVRRACLKVISNGTQIEPPHILSTRVLMLSCSRALFESKFWMIFPKSLAENVTVDRRLSVI